MSIKSDESNYEIIDREIKKMNLHRLAIGFQIYIKTGYYEIRLMNGETSFSFEIKKNDERILPNYIEHLVEHRLQLFVHAIIGKS